MNRDVIFAVIIAVLLWCIAILAAMFSLSIYITLAILIPSTIIGVWLLRKIEKRLLNS